MSFKLLGGGSSIDTIVNDVNQNVLELKGREVTEIFKDETGIRRVLLGKGPDGFYGMKVSQPTFDVFTATDDQLIFNSGQNVFKIIDKLEIPYSAASSALAGNGCKVTLGQDSVAHGLGYTPAYIAFRGVAGDYDMLPLTDYNHNAGQTSLREQNVTIDVNDTDVIVLTKTVLVNMSGGADTASFGAGTVTVYLLQESAN